MPSIGDMRGLVQRVKSASVTVAGEVVGAIDHGLCVLVGVTHDDTATLRAVLAFDDVQRVAIEEDPIEELVARAYRA